MKLPEKIFEHGAVQAAFVAKIVVEHRFVGVRRRGNFLRARPRHSLGGEMLLGGGQDAPRRRRILHFSASSWHVLFLRLLDAY